jgi:hypothetical protein
MCRALAEHPSPTHAGAQILLFVGRSGGNGRASGLSDIERGIEHCARGV